MKYYICYNKLMLELVDEVQKYLDDGYKPYGEIFIRDVYICQVVIKE